MKQLDKAWNILVTDEQELEELFSSDVLKFANFVSEAWKRRQDGLFR